MTEYEFLKQEHSELLSIASNIDCILRGQPISWEDGKPLFISKEEVIKQRNALYKRMESIIKKIDTVPASQIHYEKIDRMRAYEVKIQDFDLNGEKTNIWHCAMTGTSIDEILRKVVRKSIHPSITGTLTSNEFEIFFTKGMLNANITLKSA